MSSTVLLLDQVAERWADGLQRACWQGGLFIGMVWIVGRMFPRLPASLRCGLWWLSSLKLLCGLVLTSTLPLTLLPGQPEPIAMLSSPSSPLLPTTVNNGAARARLPLSGSTGRSAAFPTVTASRTVVLVPEAWPASPPQLSHTALLLLLWLAGLAVHLILAARQFHIARRLLRDSRPLESVALLKEAEHVAQVVGLRRRPAYRVSGQIAGPVVVGLLRPVVLLPEGFHALSESQRAMVLAHELAHLRRGDLWLSLLPVVVQALFYFYPPAWLARREFSVCREAACDAMAIHVTEQAAADYGRLLLSLLSTPSQPVVGLGASSGYRQLQRRLMMLQTVSPLSRRRLKGCMALLVPTCLLCMLPWRVVAASPSDADALADNPDLDKKVEIDAEGIPLQELLRQISRKTGISLRADAYVAEEKIVLFSPARPLKEVLADIATLFNDRWVHRKSEQGAHSYDLVRYSLAKEYEDGLDVAALTHISTQFDALLPVLTEAPAQLAQRPENDVSRRVLTDPDARLAAQIYAGTTQEQRARLFQEAKIHLPFAALAPAQQAEVQQHWLAFLDAEKQRKQEMPEVDRTEFHPDDVQRKGVTLSLSNRSGSFHLDVAPIGCSIAFRSDQQWRLPAHGNPYTHKPVPRNVALPDLEPLKRSEQETQWLDRLHTLSKASWKTVMSDYYRSRAVALPGPEAVSSSPKGPGGEKEGEEFRALDRLCHPSGYLWWADDKTLFFRKRDWYTQMRYEIPDSWLLALPAHLKAQHNHLTYSDVFSLLNLSMRQMVGLNSMRFKNQPVGNHFLGESNEAELAGLQDLLTLAKTSCPNPDSWLPKTSEIDRSAAFYEMKDLTPAQNGLLSSFLDKQATSLEYTPEDACFLQILSGDEAQLVQSPTEAGWMLIEIHLETQSGRSLRKPGVPDRSYLMLITLPTSVPDNHDAQTKVALLP